VTAQVESNGIVILAIIDAVLATLFFLFRVLPWSKPGPWRLIWITATLAAVLFTLGETSAMLQGGTALSFEIQGPMFGAILATTTCFILVFLHGSRISEHALTLAFTDDLTHLPNSRAFSERLAERMKGSDPFTLSYLQILGLGSLNDLYGAERGDAFLRGFAGILRDSAGAGSDVGRLGGNQFAMLIPGLDAAAQVRERITAGLRNLVVRDFGGVDVKAAVGTVSRTEASDPGRLIRLAYRAMEESMRTGPEEISSSTS
jgi:diguanylate cyclase (GGDEF)-like protein